MQGGLRSFLSRGSIIKNAVLHQVRMVNPLLQPVVFSRFESAAPARMEEHGFENTTITDILNAKGKGADGSWLWCTTDDTVCEAVRSVCVSDLIAVVIAIIWLEFADKLMWLTSIVFIPDDPAQCWSIGGCETWGAEVNCWNYN